MSHATTDVMSELESLGTEQNRKVYARHGVTGPAFGISLGNLGKVRKSIGTDHDLARELWATGNHDARVLATMIGDPRAASKTELDAWAKDLGNYVITDAFSQLAARSPDAAELAGKWRGSKDEWIGSAGWNVTAMLASGARGASGNVSGEDGETPVELIETIERTIHGAKNRVRYSMNNALIAIGTMSDDLAERAIAAAQRIGTVDVDHGETGCKTPDAAPYIVKARAHRKKKAQKG
jgi:3-methyladenine DNA glycosylase AlkD